MRLASNDEKLALSGGEKMKAANKMMKKDILKMENQLIMRINLRRHGKIKDLLTFSTVKRL